MFSVAVNYRLPIAFTVHRLFATELTATNRMAKVIFSIVSVCLSLSTRLICIETFCYFCFELLTNVKDIVLTNKFQESADCEILLDIRCFQVLYFIGQSLKHCSCNFSTCTTFLWLFLRRNFTRLNSKFNRNAFQ